MRTCSTALLTLGFALALSGAAAAQAGPDADAPIATGAAEILSSAGAQAPRSAAAPEPLSLAGSRQPLLAIPPQSASRPAPARVSEPRRPGEVMQLGSNASVMARRNGIGEPTGGFLRANPHFEKRDRRTIGLALRF